MERWQKCHLGAHTYSKTGDNGVKVQQPLLKKGKIGDNGVKGATTFIKKWEKCRNWGKKGVGRAAPTRHKHQGNPHLAGPARSVLFKLCSKLQHFPALRILQRLQAHGWEFELWAWSLLTALCAPSRKIHLGKSCWAGAHPGELTLPLLRPLAQSPWISSSNWN